MQRHGVANRQNDSELLKVIRKTFQPFAPFRRKSFDKQNLFAEYFWFLKQGGIRIQRHGVANRHIDSELLKVIRKTFQPFAPFRRKSFDKQNLFAEYLVP
ncbi:MAG: hypothetical protein E7360_01855 [Clostridiales bacterium]|nr:hypothetical protein [Clostridiales bacterium]